MRSSFAKFEGVIDSKHKIYTEKIGKIGHVSSTSSQVAVTFIEKNIAPDAYTWPTASGDNLQI